MVSEPREERDEAAVRCKKKSSMGKEESGREEENEGGGSRIITWSSKIVAGKSGGVGEGNMTEIIFRAWGKDGIRRKVNQGGGS